MLPERLSFKTRESRIRPAPAMEAGAAAGVAVHLVMPWFLPLAALAAWLGVRAALDLRAEKEAPRSSVAWMLILMSLPLLFWLIAQFRPE